MQRLARDPRWQAATPLAGLTLIIGLVKYAFGLFPLWTVLNQLALHWRTPGLVPLDEDYLLSSPLAFLVPGLLGLTSSRLFLATSLVFTVVACTAPFFFSSVRAFQSRRRLMFLAIVGGPILPILLNWIGGYDAFTVLAASLAILARRPWVRGIGWFLFAFNHSFVAMFAIVVWAILVRVEERPSTARAVAVAYALPLFGVLAGSLAVTQLTAAWGMELGRIDMFLRHGWLVHLELLINNAPLIVFSTLGCGWLLLLDAGMRKRPVTGYLLGLSLAVSLTMPMLAIDQTRVAFLVLLAPLLYWVRTTPEAIAVEVNRVWWRYLPVALILPVVLVFSDTATYNGWRMFGYLPPLSNVLELLRSL